MKVENMKRLNRLERKMAYQVRENSMENKKIGEKKTKSTNGNRRFQHKLDLKWTSEHFTH